MNNYRFFQNKDCEYFPCHTQVKEENFNCLFCFCPLYALGEDCGGNCTFTEQGIKDCSNCTVPHQREGYDAVMKKMALVLDLVKKQDKP